MTGTNTDDTENDAEDDNGDDNDNDDVTSIASASTVPPSLIDGMTKYFTPASRQRKHSSEQMEVSLLKVAASKLNKSMESNKSDASSSHKSTTSGGGGGGIKKKQSSSSLAKRKTHENGDDDGGGGGVRHESGGGGDTHLNANLNNSDKENQTKQQQQHLQPLEPPTSHHQPQIRFDINVDNIKRESSGVDGKKSQKNQKSKSNISEADKSMHQPGIYMSIFYSIYTKDKLEE